MEKTPENVLQQEILRERAEVLGRAGDSVHAALATLNRLDAAIEGRFEHLGRLSEVRCPAGSCDLPTAKARMVQEINCEIKHYNRLREYAQLRYHYLIITREALGLRRHQKVEEMYAIPPKKKQIREV